MGEKIYRFNPTLVRLRRFKGKPARHLPLWFQSHAGSIEAAIERVADRPLRFGFNPTLVRLRLICA